ncbi:hypothetical protein QJS10_CPA01g00435 [Acorus calamus]|uniref:Uncharacterized protein n=1 Tax=Acorus calamus TaxID=4465 RepID=A0AAV9FKG3_ACOCL|nr:hypothetical protein QJS10_CPA01g00435 [Acorus calamus]
MIHTLISNLLSNHSPSGNNFSSQRVFHDHSSQLDLLSKIDLLSLHCLPFKLPHQIRHIILQMKQRQSHPGTDPPPHPERHHLYLPAPRYVDLTTTKKPLRLELHWLLPHLLVPTHLRHHHIHRRVLRYNIPIHAHLLRHRMRQQKVPWRVPPQPLQHHRLHVRHPLNILLLHLLCFFYDDAPYLFQDPLLHALVPHQVRHDPLEHRRSRDRSPDEELRTQTGHLPLFESPPTLFGREPQLEQGISVSERIILRGSLPGLYKGEVHLLLPLPDLHELLPPLPEYKLR